MRALIVALSIATLVAGSPEASAATSPSNATQALVELDVNGMEKGDVVALARGDVLLGVDAASLEAAGVPVPAQSGFTVDGRRFVDPANVGPRVRTTYDSSQLILSVAVTAASLQQVDLSARDSAADFSHPSASLDYDVLGVGGFEHQVSLSGAVVAGRDQLVAQAIVGDVYAEPTAFFEHDIPARRFQYSAGQLVSAGDQELPALSIIGAAGLRDFSLTPLQQPFPLPVYSGVTDEPAVADIYVGGVLMRSIPVAPGQFALRGIGDATGSNVQIVLRDAQGIIRTISGGSFLDVNLLAPGTTDRSYAIGRDLSSGRAVADTMYRLGVTSHLTAGIHVRDEAGVLTDSLSGDLSAGFAQFHLGAERSGNRTGIDAYTALNGLHGRIALGYVNLPPSIDEVALFAPQHVLSLSAATSLGRNLEVSAELTRQGQAGVGAGDSIVANVNVSLPLAIAATMTFERDSYVAAKGSNHFALTFSVSKTRKDGRSVVSSSMQLSPQGSSLNVGSSPTGDVGPHSNVRIERGYSVLNYGVASTEGTADASLVQLPTGPTASYELKGGVAVIDGHARLARTVDDGFALVEMPGVGNTPIYVNGRYAGRTGADGNLLVGNLGPYQASTISVHPEDLPLDVQIENVTRTVVPPRRGGSVARFPAHFITLVQGHVLPPEGSSLSSAIVVFTHGSQRARARLDDFNDFVVDRLSPGRWVFVISRASSQPCAGAFTVPTGHAALVDLGSLVCQTQFAAR